MDARLRAESIERAVRLCGVPEANQQLTWDDLSVSCPREREMREALARFSREAGAPEEPGLGLEAARTLLLCGPASSGGNGTGKTTACGVAVLEACRRGARARIVRLAELLALHREEAYGDEGVGAKRALKPWVRPELLVIDELCKTNQSADTVQTLLWVVDGRSVMPGRRTVLVTNMSADLFAESFGASLASRVGRSIVCDWGDRRRRG